jgi:hypothetical protein
MRKFTVIAAALLALHTLEEATQSFWKIDVFTLSIAGFLQSDPQITYWIGQELLYAVIMIALFTRNKVARAAYVVLLIIMLSEIEHVIASAISGRYEPGLITGTVLAVYGAYATIRYYRHHE